MQSSVKQKPFKRLFIVSVLLVCSLGSFSLVSAQRRDWEPKRTWVFIVGLLKWKDSENFPSFPQANRRDAQLADYFRREGVPMNQLVFLRDEQATTRRVKTQFSEMLSQTQPGDTLFVYFTGHGYKSDDERTTFFATYDASERTSGWSTRSIVEDINWGFHGSQVLLTADCCFSGALARDARRLDSRLGYACFTSATSDEESTQNWTFTEMLLASLRGRSYADLNDDGQVTLSELAENERRDMNFAEDQQPSFTSRRVSNNMVLAAAQEPTSSEIGRRVVVRSEGDWYKARIVDVRGNRYRVHYYGYEDSDDEWVTSRQIRRENTAGRGFAAADKWLLGNRSSSAATANSW